MATSASKPRAGKKKLGNAKPKVTMKKVAKAAGDHWFDKLTKQAQAAYLKAHPNSKYAKGRKSSAVKNSAKAVTKATTTKAPAVKMIQGLRATDVSAIKSYQKQIASLKSALAEETDAHRRGGIRRNLEMNKERIALRYSNARKRAKGLLTGSGKKSTPNGRSKA